MTSDERRHFTLDSNYVLLMSTVPSVATDGLLRLLRINV